MLMSDKTVSVPAVSRKASTISINSNDKSNKDNKDGNQEFVEQLLRGDFRLCSEVLQNVPEDRKAEFSEILFEMSQKCNILTHLLQWAVEKETNSAKRVEMLFREDSFAVLTVSRLLFNVEGIQFLQQLLIRTISTVVSIDHTLQVSTNIVGAMDGMKNTMMLLDILQKFFEHFQQLVPKCPRSFVDLLRILHRSVLRKFDENSAVHFVLSFLFFKYICVALYNPGKYYLAHPALLTKDHVMSNLLLVSKLLNDFSLKNTTSGRYNDIIDTFISEKHDFMVAQVQALLAKPVTEEDETDSVVSNASSPPMSEVDQSDSTASSDSEDVVDSGDIVADLKNFLSSVDIGESDIGILIEKHGNGEIKSNSVEMYELKLRQYHEMNESKNWKKMKEHKDFVMFSMKGSVAKVKGTATIEASIKQVFNLLSHRYTEVDPICTKYDILSEEQITPTLLYRTVYLVHDPPMMISRRDTVVEEWVETRENHIIWIACSDNGKLPRSNGIIRSHVHCCVIDLKADPKNSSHCQFSMLFHGSVGGRIPAFLDRQVTLGNIMKILMAKTILEQNPEVMNHVLAEAATPAKHSKGKSPKHDKKTKKEANKMDM